jgi:hypothetical protein
MHENDSVLSTQYKFTLDRDLSNTEHGVEEMTKRDKFVKIRKYSTNTEFFKN